MARSRKTRYQFDDLPCVRCGVNIVTVCTVINPPPGHPGPAPWHGVCRECYTPEERKRIEGSGAGHFARID